MKTEIPSIDAATAAQLKKQHALDLLQRAQQDVYSAAQELCSADGYADEWVRICKLGDSIKAMWHRLEQKRIRP